MRYTLLLSCIAFVFACSGAHGDPGEAASKESENSEPPAELTISGEGGLVYEYIKDGNGELSNAAGRDGIFRIKRQSASGLNIDGRINGLWSKHGDKIGGAAQFTHQRWELNLSGDLCTSSKTYNGAIHSTRTDELKSELIFKITENLPLSLSYSGGLKKISEGDSTVRQDEYDEFGLLIQHKTQRLETTVDLHLEEKRGLPKGTKTTGRRGGLKSVIHLMEAIQVNLGVRPSDSRTQASGDLDGAAVERMEYEGGVTVTVSPKLRLSGDVELTDATSETPSNTSRTQALDQDYRLLYQPRDALSIDAGVSLSGTEGAGKSTRINGKVEYSPRGVAFLGKTGIRMQVNQRDDSGGRRKSRDIRSDVSNAIKITKAMDLTSRLVYSTGSNYPVAGERTSSADLSLDTRFSHKVARTFQYRLTYRLGHKDRDGQSQRTADYKGDVTCKIPFRGRTVSLVLNQALTYSRIEQEDRNGRSSEASIEVPVTRNAVATYSYGNCRPGSGGADLTEENRGGLRLGGPSKPFYLKTEFGTAASSGGATKQTIKASLSCSFHKGLMLDVVFMQDKTLGQSETPVSFTAGLKQTF
jgi:hypothetical protein